MSLVENHRQRIFLLYLAGVTIGLICGIAVGLVVGASSAEAAEKGDMPEWAKPYLVGPVVVDIQYEQCWVIMKDGLEYFWVVFDPALRDQLDISEGQNPRCWTEHGKIDAGT